MVRLWVAGKTVWSLCYTRAISECCRDEGLITKCYIIYLFTFMWSRWARCFHRRLSVRQSRCPSVWVCVGRRTNQGCERDLAVQNRDEIETETFQNSVSRSSRDRDFETETSCLVQTEKKL